MRRLKIAYVSANDASNQRTWSGIHYFLARALERHCGDVSYIAPLVPRLTPWLLAVSRRWNAVSRRRYSPVHSILMSRSFARIIERRLRQQDCDVIFAPVASTEVACLRTHLPIVYMSDSTFARLNGYYPWLENLLPLSVREGHWIERAVISRAAALLYSTSWAAKSAVSDYGAVPERVHVVPFGANVAAIPSRESATARSLSSPLRLLFLGTDWPRKGGDIAVETLRALEQLNIKAELTICGCTPPQHVSHDRLVVIPFLDKDDPAQRARFDQLLLTSDLMLVPTRADCSPIAFAEANAFGLPVVTTDTGGVSGVVSDGENGLLLSPSAGGRDYAMRIAELLVADGRYQQLVRSSRAAFDERLNWDAWGRQVSGIMSRLAERAVAGGSCI